jgi:hypothetical protein
VIMEFEVPKRHILRPTLFTDTVQRVSQWERQKMCSSRKRQEAHGREMLLYLILNDFFFGRREDEDKKIQEKTREGSILFFFCLKNIQNCPF